MTAPFEQSVYALRYKPLTTQTHLQIDRAGAAPGLGPGTYLMQVTWNGATGLQMDTAINGKWVTNVASIPAGAMRVTRASRMIPITVPTGTSFMFLLFNIDGSGAKINAPQAAVDNFCASSVTIYTTPDAT